ncbi:hypothetical protein [Saccharobesus litoralis]|nr:hypothetical protein [Saccharobesus litoralis]
MNLNTINLAMLGVLFSLVAVFFYLSHKTPEQAETVYVPELFNGHICDFGCGVEITLDYNDKLIIKDFQHKITQDEFFKLLRIHEYQSHCNDSIFRIIAHPDLTNSQVLSFSSKIKSIIKHTRITWSSWDGREFIPN